MYLKPEKVPLLGKASVYTPNLFKLVPPLNKHFSPSLSFVEEYWDNKGYIVLVVFNHKQVIIDLFKHCKLTVVMDGSEDRLIHHLKPNHSYATG